MCSSALIVRKSLISETISEMAVWAAIDFVEVCCQHAAYITRRGNLDEEIDLMETGEY